MTPSLSRHGRALSPNDLPGRPWHLLVLSAKSEASLEAATANLVDHLQRNRDLDIADVAFTLQVGRQLFEHRRTVICSSVADAIEAFGSKPDGRVRTIRQKAKDLRVAFVFPGENPPINTARELYETEAVFGQEIDRLAEQLRPLVNVDLRRLLYPSEEAPQATRGLLRDCGGTAAALFAIECAMARLWESWGVFPAAVMGYGSGEYASASYAGVMELEAAAVLAITRARVLSGEFEQTEFMKLTKSLRLHPAQLPCVSSVTGAWMPENEATDPSYWLRQLQWASAVEAGAQTLAADGFRVLLQVGPGSFLPQEQSLDGRAPLCLCSLPDPQSQESDLRSLIAALGTLYAEGAPINWSGFYAGHRVHRTPLPSYAFERRRFWFVGGSEAGSQQRDDQAARSLDTQKAGDHHTIADASRPDFGNTPASPTNKVEETLIGMCESLLGIEGVGIHDNVVELGADSLFTMQLSRQVGEAFGLQISPHHLFVEPNIASLARKIHHSGPLNERFDDRASTVAEDQPATGRMASADCERLLTFVEGLSEAQVEELLRRVAD